MQQLKVVASSTGIGALLATSDVGAGREAGTRPWKSALNLLSLEQGRRLQAREPRPARKGRTRVPAACRVAVCSSLQSAAGQGPTLPLIVLRYMSAPDSGVERSCLEEGEDDRDPPCPSL